MMCDKFAKDYPEMYDMFINMFNRINELEYQNAQLKLQLEQFENIELANNAVRQYVFNNMFAINCMAKYLKDIGAI